MGASKTGKRWRTAPLTEGERRGLIASVRSITTERVLTIVDAQSLPEDERLVFRLILEAIAAGHYPKAVELAVAAKLTLPQLEHVCNRLLARGLIGPGSHSSRIG